MANAGTAEGSLFSARLNESGEQALTHDTQLDVPAELLYEGPKLGSYTLVRQLGSGAMGDVWLARHALLARPAAVKVIRKQALDVDPEKQEILRARFQREAQATARLRSPHTVELYDFIVSKRSRRTE